MRKAHRYRGTDPNVTIFYFFKLKMEITIHLMRAERRHLKVQQMYLEVQRMYLEAHRVYLKEQHLLQQLQKLPGTREIIFNIKP